MKKNKKSNFRKKITVYALSGAVVLALIGYGMTRWQPKPDETPCFGSEKSEAVSNPASDPGDYFPLAVGNQWRYKSQIGGKTGSDLSFQVTEENSATGTPTLYLIRNEQLNQDEYYEKSAAAVLFRRQNTNEIAPPQPILPLPLSAGTGRNWTGTIGNDEFSAGLQVVKEEMISVPAGKFTAWKIRIENRNDQGDLISYSNRWFAPGVGLIKEKGADLVNGAEINFCAELTEYHLK